MTAFTLLAALSVHGWIDAYYAANSDDAEPKLNFFSGTGTAAHRANLLGLNVAALDVVRDPKPFGFHLTLVAGDAADVVHASEPHFDAVRNIYQASLTYDARAVQLEAGVYPSHIGYEAFFTKDNWNYTRGWLGEFSPYYQAGVKASRAFGKKWSGQLHVMRGWQNVTAKSALAVGTQIVYNDSKWSASFNTYADRRRTFGDLVAVYKVTPSLSVGGTLDSGRERPATWLGAGGYARYAFDERNAVATRVERFHDPRAGITGFAQTLSGATLTYEFRPSAHVILKAEARRDHSNALVFSGRRNETLAIASAVVVY